MPGAEALGRVTEGSWLLGPGPQTAPAPAPSAALPRVSKVTLEQLFQQQEQEEAAVRRAKGEARGQPKPPGGALALSFAAEAEPDDALDRSGTSVHSYGSDALEYDAMMTLSAPQNPLQRARVRSVVIWLATSAVLFLANQLTMLPVGFYPSYAQDSLGMSPWAVNLFFSLYPLCIMICSPLAASATPVIGRQSLVCLGLMLSGASTIAFAYVDSISSVFMLRVFQGVGAGAAVVGAVSVQTEEFEASVGHIVVVQEFVVAAAFVSAPPLGSYLYEYYGFEMPFLVLGAAQLLAVLIIPYLFIEYSLPDGLYAHGHTSRTLQKTTSFREAKGYREVLTPVCLVCLGITTFAMASFGFIDPYLGSHLQLMLGAQHLIVGFGFAVNALVYFIGGLVYMWLSRVLGCRQVIVIGLVQLSIGFLFLGPAPFLNCFFRNSGALWVAQSMALVLIGCGSALTIAPALPMTLMSVEAQGTTAFNLVVGLFSAAMYLGQTLGPVMSLILMSVLPATRSANCYVDTADATDVQATVCDSPLPWTFAAYALLAAAVLVTAVWHLPSGQISSPRAKQRRQSHRRIPLARQPSDYGQYVFFDDDECDE